MNLGGVGPHHRIRIFKIVLSLRALTKLHDCISLSYLNRPAALSRVCKKAPTTVCGGVDVDRWWLRTEKGTEHGQVSLHSLSKTEVLPRSSAKKYMAEQI